jgi:hypothetical protein
MGTSSAKAGRTRLSKSPVKPGVGSGNGIGVRSENFAQ